MAFSEQQTKKLTTKLNPKNIRTREAQGKSLAYIEGWHAIAEANRIFGFDGWDRETLWENCVWSAKDAQMYACAYLVKVRITVRAGDVFIKRDGSGSGEAKAATPGQAHEMALKVAETDATKRALATFGNPFGLALYDKAFAGVRGGESALSGVADAAKGDEDWSVTSESGVRLEACQDAGAFAAVLEKALSAAEDITSLFGLWSQNLQALARLKALDHNGSGDKAHTLIELFKDRARELAVEPVQNRPIDKSKLAIDEPKRIRSKEHLVFVARQPCLICGRRPAQAHHLRHAQPRAMARKVSDEFTVPLCSTHHDAVHRTGDEQKWWEAQSIDPLVVARDMWAARPGSLATR